MFPDAFTATEVLNTCYITSTYSTCSVEEIVAAAPNGYRWFQLYLYRDRKLSEQIVHRVEALGYKALVLTVDVPYTGKRRNDIRNQFKLPPHLKVKNFDGVFQVRLLSAWRHIFTPAKYPSIHLSIFPSSTAYPKPKQGNPDFPIPSHYSQPFRGGPEAFHPACPGSSSQGVPWTPHQGGVQKGSYAWTTLSGFPWRGGAAALLRAPSRMAELLTLCRFCPDSPVDLPLHFPLKSSTGGGISSPTWRRHCTFFWRTTNQQKHIICKK